MFESQLLELFQQCQQKDEGQVSYTLGTLVQIVQTCTHCDSTRVWNSQPFLRNVPAGNLLLSGALLFSGSHPVQALRMLDILGVRTISTSTFFRHQTLYLQPTILHAWREHQAGLVEQLKADHTKQVILAVDERSGSPGHCAKFGATSAIEQQIRKVLDVQLLQVGFMYWGKET